MATRQNRADLITKAYLDVRLLQRTVAIIAAFAVVAEFFRLSL